MTTPIPSTLFGYPLTIAVQIDDQTVDLMPAVSYVAAGLHLDPGHARSLIDAHRAAHPPKPACTCAMSAAWAMPNGHHHPTCPAWDGETWPTTAPCGCGPAQCADHAQAAQTTLYGLPVSTDPAVPEGRPIVGYVGADSLPISDDQRVVLGIDPAWRHDCTALAVVPPHPSDVPPDEQGAPQRTCTDCGATLTWITTPVDARFPQGERCARSAGHQHGCPRTIPGYAPTVG